MKIEIEIGQRNNNRLKAGTHTKTRVLRCMGFREHRGQGFREHRGQFMHPNGTIFWLHEAKFRTSKQYFQRDMYADELQAFRLKQERYMAAQAAKKARGRTEPKEV